MKKRKVRLIGWGKAAGGKKITFGDQTRYRLAEEETLLDLTDTAIRGALDQAKLGIEDIDCIVCGMATPLQAIPCNGALIHERWAKGLDIPAIDINTTCTSFITAFDIMSSLVEMGQYRSVLLVSGDTASAALNPSQRESYELFSDGAAAFVIRACGDKEKSEVIYSCQKTWSEGAHDTEIRGGGGLLPAFYMNDDNKKDFYFDMKGKAILRLTAKKIPAFVEDCLGKSGVNREDLKMVVPHQASRMLKIMMPNTGFPEGTYVDQVSQYGNMISASIPFALCQTIEEGKIDRGDLVMLVGTAAGLTANLLLFCF